MYYQAKSPSQISDRKRPILSVSSPKTFHIYFVPTINDATAQPLSPHLSLNHHVFLIGLCASIFPAIQLILIDFQLQLHEHKQTFSSSALKPLVAAWTANFPPQRSAIFPSSSHFTSSTYSLLLSESVAHYSFHMSDSARMSEVLCRWAAHICPTIFIEQKT